MLALCTTLEIIHRRWKLDASGWRRAGRALLLACTVGLTACVDLAGLDRATPEEVAGIYAVCSLVFTPESGAPPVDVLATALEAGRPSRLSLDVAPQTFDLEYTPRRSTSSQTLRGSYVIRGRTVELRFSSTAPSPATLLLPQSLALEHQGAPQTLVTVRQERYAVPRAEYARLAGSGGASTDPVAGRLFAQFTTGPCR